MIEKMLKKLKPSLTRSASCKKMAQDPAWILRVSEGTKRAMARPSVRRRHLKGLRSSIAIQTGANFKGGNGQRPVKFVLQLEKILTTAGFIREHAIGVKGKIRNYKVDFAHLIGKIAIECDGPKHRKQYQKKLDYKKDTVLKSIGWKVIRVKHD